MYSALFSCGVPKLGGDSIGLTQLHEVRDTNALDLMNVRDHRMSVNFELPSRHVDSARRLQPDVSG